MQRTYRLTAILVTGCLLFSVLFSACGKDTKSALSEQTLESEMTAQTEGQSDTLGTLAADAESTENGETKSNAPETTAERETTTRKKTNTPAATTTKPAEKPAEETTLPPLSAAPKMLFNNWVSYEKVPTWQLFNGGFLEGLDFTMDWELEVFRLYYEDGSYSKWAHTINYDTYLQTLTDARVRKAERENGVPLSVAQKEQLSKDTERMLREMEDAEDINGTFTANDTTIFYTVDGYRYTETYRLSGEEITVTASGFSNYGLPRTMYCYYK